MHGQIGLIHRRNRMPAHDRMPVDAEDFALIGSEKVAESGVAFQLRRSDHNGHDGLRKERFADLDRLADTADDGTGIEGRADLVMAYRGIEAL